MIPHEIIGKTIKLRRLCPDDGAANYRHSLEASWRRWLPSQIYQDLPASIKQVNFLSSFYDTDTDPRLGPIVFGISTLDSIDLLGHVGLSPVGNEVEVGFAVECAFQKRGIATEAVRILCNWGLDVYSMDKIHGYVDPANELSIRVLVKCGFTRGSSFTSKFQGTVMEIHDYILLRENGRTSR